MKTESLISAGLLKNKLVRFWPLWLIYGIVLVLLFVVPLFSLLVAPDVLYGSASVEIIEHAWGLAYVQCVLFAFVASLIIAVSVNEHLFNRAAATFFGSAPMRRRTLFATSYLAGILGLLAVPAIVACVLAVTSLAQPLLALSAIGTWFALMVALTFIFYSLATLTCQLAGTRPVGVLLYCVANVLVACLEGALRLVSSALQYGFAQNGLMFSWASPLIGLLERGVWGAAVALTSVNWPFIGAYCIAAVAFTAIAALLNERRNYEMAGESIAFARLRVVLKYLAGFSMALLFGAIGCIFFWSGGSADFATNGAGAFALFAMMATGGFLGLLLSEGIMRKSSRVFAGCWKGGLALTCVVAAIVVGCYFDVTGATTRVPNASSVASVRVACDGANVTFSSNEGIKGACELNEAIVDYGRDGERAPSANGAVLGNPLVGAFRNDEFVDDATSVISFDYELENGMAVQRLYPVRYRVATEEDPNPVSPGRTIMEKAASLMNSDEGRASRFAAVLNADGNELSYEFCFFGNKASDMRIVLTGEQKANFIANALAVDLLDNHAADYELFGSESSTELDAYLEVIDERGAQELSLWLDTAKTPETVKWLQAHFPDIKLKTD